MKKTPEYLFKWNRELAFNWFKTLKKNFPYYRFGRTKGRGGSPHIVCLKTGHCLGFENPRGLPHFL